MNQKSHEKSTPLTPLALACLCYGLTIILLPVGLGGNRPIPMGLAQVGLAFSALLLVSGYDTWKGIRLHRRLVVVLVLLIGVVGWAWAQSMPILPTGWSHPLWAETATSLGVPLHGTVAIAPEAARAGLYRLISYIACGFLAYCLFQDPQQARQMVRIIWVGGVIICAYGLGLYIAGSETILWFPKWAYFDDLTATFVNRNHFALFAGIVMTCGMAMMVQSWRQAMQSVKPAERVLIAREWLRGPGLVYGVLMALVFLSIILSHSRTGLVLAVMGCGGYLLLFAVYKKHYRRAFILGLAFIAILFVVTAIATSYSDRFATLLIDDSSSGRQEAYGIAWRAIQDNPWFGYGLNGFAAAFKLYEVNMVMEFDRVHSDYLESLLDLGIPAALMLWGAIGLMITGLVHGIRTRHQDGMYPVLGLTTSLMVLGHVAVDFSLQIPGVTCVWCALLGTGLAQSWSQRDPTSRSRMAV